MSPMSPTSSINNSIASNFQPQQPQQQLQQQLPSGHNGAPANSNSSAAVAALPPPQLFWTQRRTLGINPFPRFQHSSSVTAIGTEIFVYGGIQHGVPQDGLFVIDSVSLQCQAITSTSPDRPMAKSGHTAVNIGQYIICFGGWDQTTGQCDDSLHVLHTVRKEWNKPPIQGPLPTPRHSHSGCGIGTTMYIFGGQIDNYYLGDLVSFDMKTITQNPRWEVIEPKSEASPPARAGHSAAVYEGKIYIFGGADADYFYNDIWCFDVRTSIWKPIAASGYLPSGRFGHSCTIVDGVLYIFGGSSPDGSELNDAYAFKINERRWYLFQNIGPAPSPRSGHTMCTVKDKIFLLGGNSERADLDDGGALYYIEIPKIRFPDAQLNTPRQAPSSRLASQPSPSLQPQQQSQQQSQQPLQAEVPSEYDPQSAQGVGAGNSNRLDRPDRSARPITQRPTSPAAFGSNNMDQQQASANMNNSQHTRQPMNSQQSQWPMGVPPRGASAGQTTKNGGEMDNESPVISRRTMQMSSAPIPNTGGAAPPSLRSGVNNQPPGSGELNPTMTRSERDRWAKNSNGMVSPAAPTNIRREDEINSDAADTFASSQGSQVAQGAGGASYFPPPPSSSGSTASANMRQNGTSSPTLSAQNSSQHGRSPSPATASQRAHARGQNASASSPHLPSAAGGEAYPNTSALSSTDMGRLNQLEQQMKERDEQLEVMRRRENWLVTEVLLARQVSGSRSGQNKSEQDSNDDQLLIAELEKEMENQQLEDHQLKVTKALLKLKDELRRAKMSIATQSQAASFKIREAERIRTGALQEAAYLKAKLSSLSSSNPDSSALARIETDRAMDLEKRLTSALSEMETLELQFTKSQEMLQQEKMARLAAEERSNDSTILAEQAQAAHTRALAELASLHSRAAKAEQESREYATQLVESQAGFSGHQSQSSGLMAKIKELKQQIEEHQTALERTQMAYSAANERASRAETMYEESSGKFEKMESLRAEMASDLSRYKTENERLQSKVEDLEGRWQISKDEVVTLRKLVEDGLGAFNPRSKSQNEGMPAARKHDSIAILNTVSKVSELEHELSSLRVLHKNSQAAASKSATELADAMIELSRLEQSSMKSKAETISLQRHLAQERETATALRNELSRTEQELEVKVKELENNEVQLGLLKDVMREKGIIAEDVMMLRSVSSSASGARSASGDSAAALEAKVRQLEGRVQSLELELEQVDQQRQAAVQHSEKSTSMSRKLRSDLAAATQEKESLQAMLEQLQQTHARCGNEPPSSGGSRNNAGQMNDDERRSLHKQIKELQNRLAESEKYAAELSQKVVAMTERVDEVQTLNEAIAEQLESVQEQADAFKKKAQETIQILEGDNSVLEARLQDSEKKVMLLLDDMQNSLTTTDGSIGGGTVGQNNSSPYGSANLLGTHQQVNQQMVGGSPSLRPMNARLHNTTGGTPRSSSRTSNGRSGSGNSRPINSTSPSGLSGQRRNNNSSLGNSPSPNQQQYIPEEDVYNYGGVNNNNQHQTNGSAAGGHGQYPRAEFEDEEDPNSIAYRDSMDSITRELEMLKVPWNKASGGGGSDTSNGSNGRKSTSPLQRPYQQQQSPSPSQQQQQQKTTTNGNYYGSGNGTGAGGRNKYMYDEDDDEDGEASYLTHLQPRQYQQQQQSSGPLDTTRSFNDRSASRLKEYEQMIDEIENARRQQ
ncbi:hypothetical protein BCR41DRAFT_371670 [Lobosporangium transversale]|uniref:Tip elongation aberrant protein 1 n=1 Tax=Lobosporangium transversale TaxID=64571 RepID=A0A1Y2GM03_9FUNG|nr:hypothetical protein BCR41DRAFT_371670 [Lobosporangium transversale]ORZ12975.1 hypothetical protein BCR41DRAFT_371670 [Lobosporangium transversale]|eukprot:XP_021880324.1 hypothetical protein BCR41DRAFT_371670 [Lobosporangium transversale]